MTNHPITPPPELYKQWEHQPRSLAFEAAYRAGADQELEACCADIHTVYGKRKADLLRATRRPKPPSLKEQALNVLMHADGADHPVPILVLPPEEAGIIRRALEAMPDD
jgi:uncharacterized protein YeaO (DUF488 family)